MKTGDDRPSLDGSDALTQGGDITAALRNAYLDLMLALAERAGLGFGWVGDARAYHQWHPTADPPVHHAADIVRNATLFHERWGWWPMEGWLRGLADAGVVERTGLGWRLCAE